MLGSFGIPTIPPPCCKGGIRVLIDGSQLNQTGSFYLASRPYTEANGPFIQQVLEVLTQADALTLSDRAQSITLLANAMGLPEAVIASYLDHRPPTAIQPLSQATVAAQQRTADLFFANRLLPVKVDISQRVWQPAGQLSSKPPSSKPSSSKPSSSNQSSPSQLPTDQPSIAQTSIEQSSTAKSQTK